jgi:hypothetical protein
METRPTHGSSGAGGPQAIARYCASDVAGERLKEKRMGGISLGGIIVIVGVVTMIFWSFWIGLIVTLIGLIAFGGFARGKWY